jgi:hypothetical protein
MLLSMTVKLPKTRSVQIEVSCRLTTVWMWCRTADITPAGARMPRETRVIRMQMQSEPTNDELIQYAQEMARFCVDPAKRRFRPPRAMVWREVTGGYPETSEHGEARDGRPFPMDPLPLEGGFPEAQKSSTIMSAAEPLKGSAAKPPRSSAREPSTRTLGKGRHRALPGG